MLGDTEPARVVLGAFATPFVRRALRWLSVQAVRIANGLDPDPEVPWSGTLICVEPAAGLELGDVPTRLRSWVKDEEARHTAHRQLLDGAPYTLTVSDWTGRYLLTVSPVSVPATHAADPDEWVPAPDRASYRRHRAKFALGRGPRSPGAHPNSRSERWW